MKGHLAATTATELNGKNRRILGGQEPLHASLSQPPGFESLQIIKTINVPSESGPNMCKHVQTRAQSALAWTGTVGPTCPTNQHDPLSSLLCPGQCRQHEIG